MDYSVWPPPPARHRANVLLVDDRAENLEALVAVLAPLDQNLVLAQSGEEALKCLLQMEFALILLDVRMPGMDGFETAAHIKAREKTRSVPIIFLTAVESDPFHALRGYSEGGVDYIAKPFDPWMLRSKVTVFIDLDAKNHKLREQAEALSKFNEELIRLAEEAEAASNAKSTFLNMAGHELRTPLTVINGYAALVLGGGFGDVPEQMVRPLSVIETKADELTALAESIMAAAKVEADVIPTVPELIELNALVEAAVNRAQPRATLLHGELTFVNSATDITVAVDSAQIGKVLDNLLNNALTYGGDNPWVRATVTWDDQPHVLIEDHGIGIPMADRDRIFDRFVRGENASFGAAGTGLGLFICREFARKNGASVSVRDAESGCGTVFVLTLPEHAPLSIARR